MQSIDSEVNPKLSVTLEGIDEIHPNDLSDRTPSVDSDGSNSQCNYAHKESALRKSFTSSEGDPRKVSLNDIVDCGCNIV